MTLQSSLPTTRRTSGLIRLEHLWFLLPLALVAGFTSLVPTTPHDFWWHLRVGQLVAEQGIPRTNLFAWTLPTDTPFVYAAWLGDWLLYICYQAFGLQGPVLARNLLALAAFALVGLEARRRSGSWRLAGLAVLLAGMVAINNLSTRPQNWAWIALPLMAIITGAYTAGQVRARALLALPIIMAFWVNIHGSFVLGPVLVALVLCGETLRRITGQEHARTWNELGQLALAWLAGCAAVLINPIGPQILEYVTRLLGTSTIQSLVIEWQPPTIRSLAGTFFFGSVLCLLAAFTFGPRRPTITDVLLVCAFLWLAWSGQRHVIWFGMIVMPIMVQSLARPEAEPRRTAALPGLSMATALLLALLVLVTQPPVRPLLEWPAPYRSLFADLPGAPMLFQRGTPVQAAAYLRANPQSGRLFNDMSYGSYLIWAVPEQPVFLDPRIELFPEAIWNDYLAISNARNYHALLVDRYQVTRIFLDRNEQRYLAQALATDPRWEREYADEISEIYRRR